MEIGAVKATSLNHRAPQSAASPDRKRCQSPSRPDLTLGFGEGVAERFSGKFQARWRRVAGSLPTATVTQGFGVRGVLRYPHLPGRGPRTQGSSRAQVRRPRPPPAPLTFFILVSRSMLGVGGARSRVRDLRCGDTGADAAAAHPAPSNFRSPVRQRLGPGTKRPRQPMAAGQRREATNQRAPHAPSRPEHGASKVRGGAARGRGPAECPRVRGLSFSKALAPGLVWQVCVQLKARPRPFHFGGLYLCVAGTFDSGQEEWSSQYQLLGWLLGQRGAMELLRHPRDELQVLISLWNCGDVRFSNAFLQSPEHCQRIFSDILNANGDCYIVL